jgi:hypothetical protein
MTMDQERPSFPVPGKDALFFKQIGIDLGSRYAAQLGFDGIEAYHDESLGAETANKKRRNAKRRRRVTVVMKMVRAITTTTMATD